MGRDAPLPRTPRLRTGVSLAFLERGSAPGRPVVLLHAWAESSASFDRLLPLLPDTLWVLAPDQRGHGEADKPATGYALADYAADVVAFLDEMAIGAAVLVGSSSGGYVCQEVAVRAPERVAGLVLVGAPRTLQGRPSFADELDALTDPVDRQWVRDSLAWFPRFHDIPDWYVDDRVEDGVRLPAHVWRDALAGLTDALPPTEVATIDAPALIVWGEGDDFLSRTDQERLAAAMPASRLVVYEDTGHLVLWEQPARVARDVTAFVAALSG